ncbi:killer cell lectin-like receptor subfamily F member 1 [Mauremys reevesii]|uniref:killer cell lectin-like receptor subfamily F member 1 n=1 Tax=Mauremys reevesii TaxID=260615 RepID=UPI00193F83AC|nr:killer cell lectin-like receptor subfamily F member 1 [Mauremys reevesii]
MEDEEGYMPFNLRPKQGGSGGPSPAWNQGSRQCPGWLQVALGAGNLILAVTVLLLAVCVSHLVSEKGQTPTPPGSDGAGSRGTATPPGSDGAGSRDTATPPGSDRAGSRDPSTAECSARLERFRSQLCPPAPPGPAGGSGCKLCPTDWQLRGDKCYWVSRRGKTWSESRADCSARGSQLLVIRDREELEFIKDLTTHSHLFWIGLSVPSPQKAWTWLDGSRLDQTQFLVSDPVENSCGAVWGKWIHSDACSSVLHWICRRDAVPL